MLNTSIYFEDLYLFAKIIKVTQNKLVRINIVQNVENPIIVQISFFKCYSLILLDKNTG